MLSPVEIPETKPATELIDGELVQKMSPKQRHQELEYRWTTALRVWAGDRGTALGEWRYEFRVPGQRFASLVPDVAYLSRRAFDALGGSPGRSARTLPPGRRSCSSSTRRAAR